MTKKNGWGNPNPTISLRGRIGMRNVIFSILIGLLVLPWLTTCGDGDPVDSDGDGLGDPQDVVTNTCTDYTVYWMDECPPGERCLTFKNSCSQDIFLMYNVGCNSDGTAGSPQCNCTMGPKLGKNGGVKYWKIVIANYTPGSSTYEPACLTESLQVMANYEQNQCTLGTRVEFTSGNSSDPYGKFDSPNISTQASAIPPPEGTYYSVPVSFKPDIACSQDSFDACGCRPLYCNKIDCPDAYLTPTTNGCSSCNAPGVGCQTTFGNFGTPAGFTIEYCPDDCQNTGGPCPSCQTANLCS